MEGPQGDWQQDDRRVTVNVKSMGQQQRTIEILKSCHGYSIIQGFSADCKIMKHAVKQLVIIIPLGCLHGNEFSFVAVTLFDSLYVHCSPRTRILNLHMTHLPAECTL